MRRRPKPLFYLLLLFLAANANSAPKSFPVQGSRSTVDWLDAFARASRLKPLTGTEGSILRVWAQNVMTGDTWGYVVTSKTLLLCRTTYDFTSFSVHPAKCRSKPISNQQASSLMLLPDLAKLDGSSLSCGVMDGGEVLLEGVTSGKRFSLVADNPDSCRDKGSKLVAKALGLLQGT